MEIKIGIHYREKDFESTEKVRKLSIPSLLHLPKNVVNLRDLEVILFNEECQFTSEQGEWLFNLFIKGCQFDLIEDDMIFVQSYKIDDNNTLPVNIIKVLQGEHSVKRTIKTRKTSTVWHFTQLSNLKSILENGLVSRTEIIKSGLNSHFNDLKRLDGYLDGICCSISHINYKMFYQLKKDNKDSKWVALAIRPSVLWEKSCLFCTTNAASSHIRNISEEQLIGPSALNKLFDDKIDDLPRESWRIPLCFPTDPQAEVLVYDQIENDLIYQIVFEDKEAYDEYSNIFLDRRFTYDHKVFSPRSDHHLW
jgi:hypothetical protein